MPRPIMKVVIGIVGFVALIVPTTSQAAPFTPLMWKAYRIATAYWGGPPPLCTSIDFEIVPSGSLETPEGEAGAVASLPAEPMPCLLWVNRSLAAPDMFDELCVAMIHEDGHLHGIWHSPDPNNVMFAEISPDSVPACIRAQHLLWRIEMKKTLDQLNHVDRRTDPKLVDLREMFWH